MDSWGGIMIFEQTSFTSPLSTVIEDRRDLRLGSTPCLSSTLSLATEKIMIKQADG